MKLLSTRLPHLTGQVWEDLCRKAFLYLPQLCEEFWLPPLRYWQGNGYEWDLISTAVDTDSIIIGECKWFTGKTTPELIQKTVKNLKNKGVPPLSKKGFKEIRYYIFIPEIPQEKIKLEHNVQLIDAKTVIQSIF
jgi:hypothetical protein